MALLIRFRRNFLLKVLTDVITKGLTFVFVLVVARRLGTDSFGVFSAAQSIAALAAILGDLGLNLLVTREIAARRRDARALAGSLFSIKLILSILVMAVLFLLTRFQIMRDIAEPLLLMGGFMVLWSTLEFFSSIFCGFERMEWETVLKGSGRFLVILLGLGALLAGWGLTGLMIGMLLAPGVVVLATMVGANARDSAWRPRWDGALLRELMPHAVSLSAVAVLVTVFVRIDILMLESLRGDHQEIGVYAAAIRIVDALGGYALLVTSALYPMYADLFHSRPEALGTLARGALRSMAVVAVPAVVGGWFLADWGVGLLYGAGYEETATALRILLPYVPLLFFNVQLSSLVIGAGLQKRLALASGFGLLLNVGANAVLIPGYGYRGAAVATVLTEGFLLTVIVAWIVPGATPRLGFPWFLWRYAGAGLVMTAVLAPLADLALLPAAVVSLLVYVLALLALGELGEEDVGKLRRLLRRNEPEAIAVQERTAGP